AEMQNENNINQSNVHTVNLHEYVGLDADNAQSYHYFMLEEFFNKVNIPLEYTHIPDGKRDDLEAEEANYEKIIADLGGIDLQVLGGSRNEDLGFNEPVTLFDSRTLVVSVTQVRINDNSRFIDTIQAIQKHDNLTVILDKDVLGE